MCVFFYCSTYYGIMSRYTGVVVTTHTCFGSLYTYIHKKQNTTLNKRFIRKTIILILLIEDNIIKWNNTHNNGKYNYIIERN